MIEPGYLAEVRGTLNVEGLLVALGFAVRVVLGAESATYQPHTMHFLILALTVTGLKVSVSPRMRGPSRLRYVNPVITCAGAFT